VLPGSKHSPTPSTPTLTEEVDKHAVLPHETRVKSPAHTREVLWFRPRLQLDLLRNVIARNLPETRTLAS